MSEEKLTQKQPVQKEEWEATDKSAGQLLQILEKTTEIVLNMSWDGRDADLLREIYQEGYTEMMDGLKNLKETMEKREKRSGEERAAKQLPGDVLL